MTYIPSADDLEVITREVWTSFLDGDPAGLVAGGDPPTGEQITGCVHLSGAYTGSIMLQCSPPAARDAAAALFSIAPGDVTQTEVVDAIGEIANMVGGNVKSMLPGPSLLSLPLVVQGVLSVPGAQVVRTVQLIWRAEPLTVSLWQQAS
ncbi:MAG: chemotaxis protein CheX [Actinomycetota bacterium]|nr:chemotaxis protein CheX [Actinomycetota bacterium]MDQ1539362.1 chemotaxis protein CheX [Actinomycetota bacterium]